MKKIEIHLEDWLNNINNSRKFGTFLETYKPIALFIIKDEMYTKDMDYCRDIYQDFIIDKIIPNTEKLKRLQSNYTIHQLKNFLDVSLKNFCIDKIRYNKKTDSVIHNTFERNMDKCIIYKQCEHIHDENDEQVEYKQFTYNEEESIKPILRGAVTYLDNKKSEENDMRKRYNISLHYVNECLFLIDAITDILDNIRYLDNQLSIELVSLTQNETNMFLGNLHTKFFLSHFISEDNITDKKMLSKQDIEEILIKYIFDILNENKSCKNQRKWDTNSEEYKTFMRNLKRRERFRLWLKNIDKSKISEQNGKFYYDNKECKQKDFKCYEK